MNPKVPHSNRPLVANRKNNISKVIPTAGASQNSSLPFVLDSRGATAATGFDIRDQPTVCSSLTEVSDGPL